MYVAGKGCQIINLIYVLLAVQDGLIYVGDTPAQGDVEAEQRRKIGCSLAGVGVAPRAERHEDVLILAESHIAVHHGRDTYGGELLYLAAVLSLHVPLKVGITILQALPDGIDAIRPETVHKPVFPLAAALSYGVVLRIYQDCLDAGGAKLDTENGPARFYN